MNPPKVRSNLLNRILLSKLIEKNLYWICRNELTYCKWVLYCFFLLAYDTLLIYRVIPHTCPMFLFMSKTLFFSGSWGDMKSYLFIIYVLPDILRIPPITLHGSNTNFVDVGSWGLFLKPVSFTSNNIVYLH